jgi:pimeloyl-ACP methyl ester carboxylesterase
VLLVHGAFAESASWDGVVAELLNDGYPVVAVANPLRGVKADADYLGELVAKTAGEVVLVGHSYGGAVISNTSNSQGKIKALVYVAAFAPEVGESCLGLSGQFPGSTLGPALAAPVGLAGGASDLYIQ